MEFLFLCAAPAGYWQHCVHTLAEIVPDARITCVVWELPTHSPFAFETHPRVRIIERKSLDRAGLVRLADELRPAIVYVAGWFDPGYRHVCRRLRRSVPVVMGCDNLWEGTFRQRAMAWLGAPMVRGFASHVWVPGMHQYEYARRLGFPAHRILSRLYSAANEQFDTIAAERSKRPPSDTILFVGSMWPSKGVHELVAAFRQLEDRFPSWRLRMVGGGDLVERYRGASPRIEVLGFQQPAQLPELFRDAGAFCLPSHAEHWGVVVHEACCAGLPIITADNCGAAVALVHDGYNGFLCRPRSVGSLRDALERLMVMPVERRVEFGLRSHELSRQITPRLWVAKLLSVLRPG